MKDQPQHELRDQLQRYRVENLRTLIHCHGGYAAMARLLGYSNHSAVSHLAGRDPKRPISETIARRIERKLGLPQGTLDEPAQQDAVQIPPDDEVRRLITTAAIKTMVRVLHQNGLTLPAEQESHLASLVADHVRRIPGA